MSAALFAAAEAGDVAAIEAAIASGADVDWPHDILSWTALLRATIEGHAGAVQALLRHGASVDLSSRIQPQWAPLGHAAHNGDEAIARALIAHGASLDLASADLRRTALMTAGQLGHTGMVALLLEAGADPHLLDHRGENAWSLAKAQGREAVLPLLEAAGTGPPPARPEEPSLPWPKVEEGAERSTPETVVRAYILAMEVWEKTGDARGLEAARDPDFWAEQRAIVARCCTPKERAFPVASFGSPTAHAAADRLLSLTLPSPSRAVVIVLHFNGVDDAELRFAVHRKGGEWRIDNLQTRLRGEEKWGRGIL